jgi:hypothetical protein
MFPIAPQLKSPNHTSFLGEGSLFRFLCWGSASIRSLSSQCVPQGCSQYHLAVISYVLPKVLPFTYIGGSKGEALHLSIKSSILRASVVSTFFFAMGQSSCVIAKKESWTCDRLIGTLVLKKGYICQGENGDEQF